LCVSERLTRQRPGGKGGSVVVPNDRAHKTDEVGRDAPALPEPLPLEHEGEHRPAVTPPVRSGKPLMLLTALVLVLIAVGWVVAIGVFIYWAVT
jgi:hypothetical protein